MSADPDSILDEVLDGPKEEPKPAAVEVDDDEIDQDNSEITAAAPATSAPSAEEQRAAAQAALRQLMTANEMNSAQQQKQEAKQSSGPWISVRSWESIVRTSVIVGTIAFVWTAGGVRASP